MKTKLWCRIFGHDFRTKRQTMEYGGTTYIYPSDWCRHCGLFKKEVLK